MKAKYFLLVALLAAVPAQAKDYFRFKSGEMVITDKKDTRSVVRKLIYAQKFHKKISGDRYILYNSMGNKQDVTFRYNSRGILSKIETR